MSDRREYIRAWREANSERIRAYKESRRAVEAAQKRDRYADPSTGLAERQRRYAVANPDVFRAGQRAYAARHPDRVSARQRADRLARAERQRRRRAAESGRVDYAAILAEHGAICYLCSEAIEGALHFDHVIPLVRGGAHVAENIRPTHATCNLRKGARMPDEIGVLA
jgi:5-methylcytosine-specific restriction endonuclease McrA